MSAAVNSIAGLSVLIKTPRLAWHSNPPCRFLFLKALFAGDAAQPELARPCNMAAVRSGWC